MPKEAKTKPTGRRVEDFIAAVDPPRRREDAGTLLRMMREVTGCEPELWGPSIIGFGRYTAVYADGRTTDWMRIGFSPRKANLVVYLIDGYEHRTAELARLGKHKIGKSCLYLSGLETIDQTVLRELVADSWAAMAARYPA